MTARAWLLLILLSLLWGGSFFTARIAVTEIPPLTLVFVRVLLAALALDLVLLVRGGVPFWRSPRWRDYVILGALNSAVPFGFLFFATREIGAGLASILNATTPIFTVVLAHLFTRDDRLTPPRLAGVLIGFAGVTVMLGPQLLTGLGSHGLADLSALAAALCYGLGAIRGRRFRGAPPVETAAGQLSAATLMTLPVALVVDRPWTLALPSPGVIAAVLVLALLSTAAAYILYFRILSIAGPTNANLVTLLVPVSAILLGTLILGERLEPRHWAGMGLILCGLCVLDPGIRGHGLALAARLRRSGPHRENT